VALQRVFLIFLLVVVASTEVFPCTCSGPYQAKTMRGIAVAKSHFTSNEFVDVNLSNP